MKTEIEKWSKNREKINVKMRRKMEAKLKIIKRKRKHNSQRASRK